MPRTPKQWKSQMSEDDRKYLQTLCERIDDAMDRDDPGSGSTNFVFTFSEDQPFPNARVQAEIVALYKKSTDRPDGWSKIEFTASVQDGRPFIKFEE